MTSEIKKRVRNCIPEIKQKVKEYAKNDFIEDEVFFFTLQNDKIIVVADLVIKQDKIYLDLTIEKEKLVMHDLVLIGEMRKGVVKFFNDLLYKNLVASIYQNTRIFYLKKL